MPRKTRIDAPGALHQIILRGIERKPIFKGDQDYRNFLGRLERVLVETSTPIYGWTLMVSVIRGIFDSLLAEIEKEVSMFDRLKHDDNPWRVNIPN